MERWPRAQVYDAIPLTCIDAVARLVKGRRHEIDAVCWERKLGRGRDVRRREPNFAATAHPTDDGAPDRIRPAQEFHRKLDVAVSQGIANPRATYGSSIVLERRNGHDIEAHAAADRAQDIDRASTIVAKGEICSYPERLHRILLAEAANELLR